MTMTFAAHAGDAGTLLTWRMVFDPSPHNDEPLRRFIAQANEQNFDRLSDYLVRA